MFWGQKHPVRDEQLSAYADGRVPSAERPRLEAHIESCASCREALAELRALRQALSSMPSAPVPRSFALREADVRRPERTSAAGGRVAAAVPVLSGVTMAAFLAFGVLLSMDMTGSTSMSSDKDLAQPASSLGVLPSGTTMGNVLPPEGQNYQGEDASLRLTATAASSRDQLGLQFATPPRSPTEEVARDEAKGDDSETALRMAEMATAAAGLVAGGSLAMVWWRRRT